MEVDNLEAEEREIVRKIWDAVDHPDEPWVRYWSADSIQIDGNLTGEELRALVHILDEFEKLNKPPRAHF